MLTVMAKMSMQCSPPGSPSGRSGHRRSKRAHR